MPIVTYTYTYTYNIDDTNILSIFEKCRENIDIIFVSIEYILDKEIILKITM